MEILDQTQEVNQENCSVPTCNHEHRTSAKLIYNTNHYLSKGSNGIKLSSLQNLDYLQAFLQRIQFKHKMTYCLNMLLPGVNQVELYNNGKTSGILTCGSSYCPHCSKSILAKKHSDLDLTLRYLSEVKHNNLLFFTITSKHHRGNDPKELIDNLSALKSDIMRHKVIRDLGFVTSFQALDYKHGEKHGHNFHYHIVIAHEKEFKAKNKESILTQIKRLSLKHKVDLDTLKGIDLSVCKDAKAAAHYLTKDGQNNYLKRLSYEMVSDNKVDNKSGEDTKTIVQMVSEAAALSKNIELMKEQLESEKTEKNEKVWIKKDIYESQGDLLKRENFIMEFFEAVKGKRRFQGSIGKYVRDENKNILEVVRKGFKDYTQEAKEYYDLDEQTSDKVSKEMADGKTRIVMNREVYMFLSVWKKITGEDGIIRSLHNNTDIRDTWSDIVYTLDRLKKVSSMLGMEKYQWCGDEHANSVVLEACSEEGEWQAVI